MITFDKFVRWLLITVGVVAALVIINYLSAVLLPFFIAWFFAYLINPLVLFLHKRLHIRPRALAILTALLIVVAVLGGVLWLIVPPMIEQIEAAGDVLFRWLGQSTHSNSVVGTVKHWALNHQGEIERFFRSKDFNEIVKFATPHVVDFLGKTVNVAMSLFAVATTLLYLFFILLDYDKLSTRWIQLFPRRQRPFCQELMSDVERALNNYIRGQSLVALCMAVLFCIGLSIIDFPMAIGFGILIGILDLVPYLHTFALIPAAFLSLLKAQATGNSFVLEFCLVVAVFIVVQIIIDMLVTPKIMGKAMGLNPAILLLSLSVWGTLLGFIGLIVALPLTTLLIAYWMRYVAGDRKLEAGSKR